MASRIWKKQCWPRWNRLISRAWVELCKIKESDLRSIWAFLAVVFRLKGPAWERSGRVGNNPQPFNLCACLAKIRCASTQLELSRERPWDRTLRFLKAQLSVNFSGGEGGGWAYMLVLLVWDLNSRSFLLEDLWPHSCKEWRLPRFSYVAHFFVFFFFLSSQGHFRPWKNKFDVQENAKAVVGAVETEGGDEEKDLKQKQSDKFRELLRDKVSNFPEMFYMICKKAFIRGSHFSLFIQYNDGKISSTSSWEQAMRYIQHDPRFRILNKVSEKKQLFNAWKVQRQKEERVRFYSHCF